jgi:hypothetical protein
MAIYLGNLELATGGGATGTGLPVNSYESFSVSATGNPTGYNATTGLYTHPNGDYWLKTGNTVASNFSDYPDAAGNPTYSVVGNTTIFTVPYQFQAGIAAPTDDFLYIVDVSGQRVYQYTKAGTATGFSFAANVSGQGPLGTNGSNNLLTITSAGVVTEYTTAGVATGLSFSVTAQIPGTNKVNGIDSDGNFIYVYDEQANSLVVQYTMAGVYTGFQFNLGTSGGDGMAIDPINNILVFDSNIAFVATTGVQVTKTGSTLRYPAFDLVDSTKLWNSYFGDIKQHTRTYQKIVGDSTARTDADSGQPLFIKLK